MARHSGGERRENRLRRMWNTYISSDCILSDAEMKRLGDHKYSAVDTSWLDEMCMKRFWESVVPLFPLWLAPNLITLIGLLINLVTCLVLSFYSFDAKSNAPSWAYALAGLGLFLYQTLDAVDGKQARRTNSSSPLGELFDHGCDSVSQVFVTLMICYALNMGDYPLMVVFVNIFSVIMFYCAHWSTYCTGQLRFSRFDVTEAQMVVIMILLTTAVFGNGIWTIRLIPGIELRALSVMSSLVGSVWQVAKYLYVIFNDGVGKNGSTVAGTSVVFPMFPLLMVCVPFCMIYSKSGSTVYDDYATLYWICFGAVSSKMANRLVIAHMSRSELKLWDWVYVAPLAMMLNQYYDYYFDELSLLVAATIYSWASLLIFCYYVCRQFCDYLHIYCFSLEKPPAVRANGVDKRKT